MSDRVLVTGEVVPLEKVGCVTPAGASVDHRNVKLPDPSAVQLKEVLSSEITNWSTGSTVMTGSVSTSISVST